MPVGDTITSGKCPICPSDRAEILREHESRVDEIDFQMNSYFRVMACMGCGEIYFMSSSTNSEDFEYFEDHETGEHFQHYNETIRFWPPAGARREPEWTTQLARRDMRLRNLLRDVYTAQASGLGVLAAIGMRTVFDRASELLQIDENLSFREKLNRLRDDGYIAARDVPVLETLIDAGSAAAHRGWQPDDRQLEAMLTILEAFLQRTFVLENLRGILGAGIPQRG